MKSHIIMVSKGEITKKNGICHNCFKKTLAGPAFLDSNSLAQGCVMPQTGYYIKDVRMSDLFVLK